jgi:hypothetical protein
MMVVYLQLHRYHLRAEERTRLQPLYRVKAFQRAHILNQYHTLLGLSTYWPVTVLAQKAVSKSV